MDKMIPYDKMSKKQKKEYNDKRRNKWQINPATRKSEPVKCYKRKKEEMRGME
jgi:hypothetical protein